MTTLKKRKLDPIGEATELGGFDPLSSLGQRTCVVIAGDEPEDDLFEDEDDDEVEDDNLDDLDDDELEDDLDDDDFLYDDEEDEDEDEADDDLADDE